MLKPVVLKPGPRASEKPVLLYYTNAAPSGTVSLPCLYWYGQSCSDRQIRRYHFCVFGQFPEWPDTGLNEWDVIGVGDAKTLSRKFSDLDLGVVPDQHFAVVTLKPTNSIKYRHLQGKRYKLLIAAIIISSRDLVSPYPYSGEPFSLPATPDS